MSIDAGVLDVLQFLQEDFDGFTSQKMVLMSTISESGYPIRFMSKRLKLSCSLRRSLERN